MQASPALSMASKQVVPQRPTATGHRRLKQPLNFTVACCATRNLFLGTELSTTPCRGAISSISSPFSSRVPSSPTLRLHNGDLQRHPRIRTNQTYQPSHATPGQLVDMESQPASFDLGLAVRHDSSAPVHTTHGGTSWDFFRPI